MGDVFPARTVAARCAAYQSPVRVQQTDRSTVEFGLRRILDEFIGFQTQSLRNATVKITHFFRGECVIEGQHGHVVFHRAEGRYRLGTDALRRRVLGNNFGMLRL